jgi:hypothetical protein
MFPIVPRSWLFKLRRLAMTKSYQIVFRAVFLLILALVLMSLPASSKEEPKKDKHDRCADLRPGKAEGIRKKCLPGGSSSGIAKGDFNGDGFADLAVGVPDETTPAAAPGAGAVIVIYGSAGGLTATDPLVPAAQFWSQNTPGIPESSESGDGFGSALASGDFNGDGFSDLAVGIPFEDIFFEGTSFDDIGAVVVIYGSSKGLSATDSSVLPEQFDLLNDFPPDFGFDDEHFGFSLA